MATRLEASRRGNGVPFSEPSKLTPVLEVRLNDAPAGDHSVTITASGGAEGTVTHTFTLDPSVPNEAVAEYRIDPERFTTVTITVPDLDLSTTLDWPI